jgi:hypothetical protein
MLNGNGEYDHFVRKSFSTQIRSGPGLKSLEKDANVIQFKTGVSRRKR